VNLTVLLKDRVALMMGVIVLKTQNVPLKHVQAIVAYPIASYKVKLQDNSLLAVSAQLMMNVTQGVA
jgi:hypothetical protein